MICIFKWFVCNFITVLVSDECCLLHLSGLLIVRDRVVRGGFRFAICWLLTCLIFAFAGEWQ